MTTRYKLQLLMDEKFGIFEPNTNALQTTILNLNAEILALKNENQDLKIRIDLLEESLALERYV